MQTYYQILNISRRASLDDIKHAYHRLAKQYHPDVATINKQIATQKFIEIHEAYAILSDTVKRREYDRILFGTTPQTQQTYTQSSQTQQTSWERSYANWQQQAQTEARKYANDYSTFNKFLSGLFRAVVYGEHAYREKEGTGFKFWQMIKCGFCAWIGVALIIISVGSAGTLAIPSFYICWLLARVFFTDERVFGGRFVGFGTVLAGMVIWVVIVIMLFIFLVANYHA